MIIDLKKHTEIKKIDADICIIGGGAAGLSLAREFDKTNTSVVILESGITKFDPEIQKLYEGDFTYFGFNRENKTKHGLSRDRIRTFGGTTFHWGGMCAPYDEIDFQKRSWVPESGWPITRSELMPFYDRASDYVMLPKYDFPVVPDQDPAKPPLKFGGNYDIATKIFYFSKIGNVGVKWEQLFKDSKNIKVYTNATVKNLNLNGQSGELDSVTVVRNDLNLPTVSVTAKKYVLATGAIENARILLTSDDVNKAGVCNDNDLVGRYFQGHGYTNWQTQVVMLSSKPNLDLYKGNPFGVLTLSPELQEKYKVLNFWMGIDFFSTPLPDRHVKYIPDVQDEFKLLEDDIGIPEHEGEWHKRKCSVFWEQEPNRDNRVELMDEKDWLGTRKSKLILDFSAAQKHTIVESMKAIALAIGKSSAGKVRIDSDNDSIFNSLDDGCARHHHGTTRMHENPKLGVVDADCRAHDVKNLYIAGASVFPTSGATNPTFTIVALSIRLADHLKKQLEHNYETKKIFLTSGRFGSSWWRGVF